MMYESNIDASIIDSSGAYKVCAELCPDCPRRTGKRTDRAKGIRGWLGKKITRSIHSNPLTTGQLIRVQTNGRNGAFYGQGSENTGAVTDLRMDNATAFLRAVVECEGPVDKGNVCSALGAKTLSAIYDLDQSMEEVISTLPAADVVRSIASDSTEVPAEQTQVTQVFINNSKPSI